MKKINQEFKLLFLFLGLAVYFTLLIPTFTSADPMGANINFVNTATYSPSPSSRQDAGAQIITANINIAQQDSGWKGYVGNVSGLYVLKNSNNFSIYQWPTAASITGEVYISRNSSVNFSTGAISCASNAQMVTEQDFLGMGATDTDNINNTFNSTNHTSFNVGTNPVAQNACRAIALWVNNTLQAPSPSALFQEVALFDTHTLVYAALINSGQFGFDNTTRYDFQVIIAENHTSPTGNAYFFYVELGP